MHDHEGGLYSSARVQYRNEGAEMCAQEQSACIRCGTGTEMLGSREPGSVRKTRARVLAASGGGGARKCAIVWRRSRPAREPSRAWRNAGGLWVTRHPRRCSVVGASGPRDRDEDCANEVRAGRERGVRWSRGLGAGEWCALDGADVARFKPGWEGADEVHVRRLARDVAVPASAAGYRVWVGRRSCTMEMQKRPMTWRALVPHPSNGRDVWDVECTACAPSGCRALVSSTPVLRRLPSATALLDSAILPALRLAKTGATGIGIPGVEPMISGVLELATMLSTMKANRDDLSTLERSLKQLIAINASGAGGDLKLRLTTLTSCAVRLINLDSGFRELKIIILECKSLTEKSRLKQFFKSKDYKDRIQNIKASIASHIHEFTFYGNISIEKSVEAMSSKVRVIDKKMDNLLAKEILAKLKGIPARYSAANTPDKCMDGTRVDIIKDIVTRLTAAPDSSERVIMLSGPAGSGKSTIAKSVTSILAEDQGLLAASFFFSRDHAERNEIKYLASTLAMQLAEYNGVFKACLVDLLETDRTGILDAEPRLQFQKMVVQILENLPPITSPWVICLDALDECGQDRGQNFLRWLSDSISRIPAHIRFFLTGRPDVPSYLKLDTLRPLMHGIVLDEIDIQIVSSDIRLYVERSLDGTNWSILGRSRIRMWKR
ncbi:hypothetical protein DFH09DRAFT_1107746 [Mycena vulgaris]|nr:hypothetical protein DFH09DRAFT_1107746 [Mycena vulgaris]